MQIDQLAIIMLMEVDNTSTLLKMSIEGERIWSCEIPYSYDFFSMGEFIYVTTKGLPKTFLVGKDNGNLLNDSPNFVIHAPVFFKSSSFVVAFATHLEINSVIIFDSEMNIISKLPTNSLKASKCVNQNSYLSYNDGIISFVDFSTLNIVWSVNLLQEVIKRTDEETVELRFRKIMVFEKVIVVRVIIKRSYSLYLFSLDIETGEIKWVKEKFFNIGKYEDNLYTMTRDGELIIYDSETLEIIEAKNLSKSFQDHDIECSKNFQIDDDKLIFVDDGRRKLGIINTNNLELELTKDYPEGFMLGYNVYPELVGDKLLLHDQLSRDLYIVSIDDGKG